MIVKILSGSGTFRAVRYNTDKLDRQTGELMRIKNFGLLDNDFALKPEEVRNYLKAFSATNQRVKSPQFHAAISCKGREYSKEELSVIAERWLSKMGYGDNPYLIIFHSDTSNNHVHIVSTRVGMDGRKINDSFEYLKAIRQLESVLKTDAKQVIDNDTNRIESFSISSVAQFRLLFELSGYGTAEKDGSLSVFRNAGTVKSYRLGDLEEMAGKYQKDTKRLRQLKGIINKYKQQTGHDLIAEHAKLKGGRVGKLVGYRSDLTDYLNEKFGLQFVFHFRDGKPPYGYTVIDHRNRTVLKGSEVMKLGDLIKKGTPTIKVSGTDEKVLTANHYNVETIEHLKLLSKHYKLPEYKIRLNGHSIDTGQTAYYRDLLKFYLKNNPIGELGRLNIVPVRQSGNWYLLDTGSMRILDAKDVLPSAYFSQLDNDEEIREGIKSNQTPKNTDMGVGWSLANDVDDEKVHGRERNRERRKRRKQ